MRQFVVAGCMAALAACSSPDQHGQLTADQDQALNRAAEMFDANSVALDDAGDNAAVENEQ